MLPHRPRLCQQCECPESSPGNTAHRAEAHPQIQTWCCTRSADTIAHHPRPGQDSNLECQDQNLVCCRLHHRVADRPEGPKRQPPRPLTAKHRFATEGPPSRMPQLARSTRALYIATRRKKSRHPPGNRHSPSDRRSSTDRRSPSSRHLPICRSRQRLRHRGLSAAPRGHAHQPSKEPARGTNMRIRATKTPPACRGCGRNDSPPWDGEHPTGPQNGPDAAT